MAKTVNCTEEIIFVSHGEEDMGKLAALATNGKFHPSVIPGIVDLQDQISKEVATRTDADKQLQTNINAEASVREVADKDLQEQLTQEVAARTDGDTALQSSIDAEIAIRADADSNLQISINTEVDARTKADQGIEDQIAAEIAARTSADEVLQSSIDVETNVRTAVDEDLQNQITKEVTARSEADKQLQANIDAAKTEANSYTDTKVAGLVNDAPATLDTLKELADALNDDSNFAAAVTNQLAQKADKSQIPTSLPANGGNADTATKLESARTINGVAFDGAADISITQVNGKDIATTDQIFDASVPVGGIIMWSGSDIPTSWALCNGSNGTPDLSGKFVLGTSASHSIGQTGGEEIHTLSIDEMPAHTHKWLYGLEKDDKGQGSSYTEFTTIPGSVAGNQVMSLTGGGAPHNNMPPYYVLAYIMRIA